MAKHFIGVDGEMTAVQTDLGDDSPPAKLIQIGVALGATESITLDIGWAAGTYGSTPEATDVHGFTDERIQDAEPAEFVDDMLFEWMVQRGIGPKEGIAVGWNVGTFDFQQFIIPTLPKFASLFSYRYVDLNSICFVLEEARNLMPPHIIKAPGHRFEDWKKRIKEVSAHQMGPTENWHDAGYDAISSLLQFQYLSTHIGAALFQ